MLALKTADHTLTRPSGPCPHPCGIQRISSTANAQGLRGLAADIGGSPVCPVPSKNSAAVPHLAIFPMLFSYTFHKDISPDCYSKFRSPVCHVPSKNSACSSPRDFSDTLSVTLSTRTVVPTAIRTFVLHPFWQVFRPQRTPQLLLTCGFSDAFPLAFHGTVKSAGLHPSVQRLRERYHLERLHRQRSCHVTSTESL